jgi:hypothetical protein
MESEINQDGWFLPGGAVIDESREVKLRLRPPPDWQKIEIELPRVPPSMNTNEIRSHWTGFQKAKKEWQDYFAVELMSLQARQHIRRGAYQRAIAGGFLRFSLRASRRDTGNYKQLLEKALGDALTISEATPRDKRFIPDDDNVRFYFGGVEFEEERGPDRTRIWVFLQPKEQ